MTIDIRQIARYLVSGLAGLATNVSAFNFFHLIVGVHYVPASALGFLAGVAVSFVCQKFFTFENREAGRTSRQFVSHLVLLSFNLAATTLIIIALVEALSLPKTLSVIVANGTAAVWSYIIYKRFVFHKVKADA